MVLVCFDFGMIILRCMIKVCCLYRPFNPRNLIFIMFCQVQSAGPQNIGLRSLNPPSQTSSLGSYEQLLQQYQQPQTQSPFRLQEMSSGTQSYRDPSLKTIQGGQTPPDPYGLLALLGVIRMNDADLASLALGMDLTTLGLNLNSADNLYKTFGSPWSNEPAKGDPEFQNPACYLAEQAPPLTVSCQ